MLISKAFKFEAAHSLPRHPGKCRRLHGHTYRLIVAIEGPVQKETGFVMDYGDLNNMVRPIVERFDHRDLNCFVRYPSAENIAIHIAHYLQPKFNMDTLDQGLNRLQVEIRETETTSGVWDSKNREDYMILATAADNPDAEWRSPIVDIPVTFRAGTTLYEALDAYVTLRSEEADRALAEFRRVKSIEEQVRLYRESLSTADLTGLDTKVV